MARKPKEAKSEPGSIDDKRIANLAAQIQDNKQEQSKLGGQIGSAVKKFTEDGGSSWGIKAANRLSNMDIGKAQAEILALLRYSQVLGVIGKFKVEVDQKDMFDGDGDGEENPPHANANQMQSQGQSAAAH